MLSDEVPGGSGGFLAGVAAGFGAGSRVAGYRLEERIGAGGMAVVFRARDERLGRLVALKILAPALAADAAFRQRFIRESQAAAAVDDPHIVPVFEAGEAGGVLFIAMRYVPGGDVRTLVDREGPLPSARAAAIISPVASALDAAHAAGLVHRDVKPANMLVDARPGRPDHVYLSDFGLSKGMVSVAGLTGAGQFLGTLDYVSPEQVEGRAVDGRADEYALACAAFELLTGGPPFPRARGDGGDVCPAVGAAAAADVAAAGPAAGRRPRVRHRAGQGAGGSLCQLPGVRRRAAGGLRPGALRFRRRGHRGGGAPADPARPAGRRGRRTAAYPGHRRRGRGRGGQPGARRGGHADRDSGHPCLAGARHGPRPPRPGRR